MRAELELRTGAGYYAITRERCRKNAEIGQLNEERARAGRSHFIKPDHELVRDQGRLAPGQLCVKQEIVIERRCVEGVNGEQIFSGDQTADEWGQVDCFRLDRLYSIPLYRGG